jgi:hypothetical protein
LGSNAIFTGSVGKDTQISVRLEAALAARAEALVAKLIGVTTRAAILREAMREGLAILEVRYQDLPSAAGEAEHKTKRRPKR